MVRLAQQTVRRREVADRGWPKARTRLRSARRCDPRGSKNCGGRAGDRNSPSASAPRRFPRGRRKARSLRPDSSCVDPSTSSIVCPSIPTPGFARMARATTSSRPSADGNSGLMQFRSEPGTSSSGSASCWAALGATVAIPNSQCLINFLANPSYTWQYWESSSWWRQAAGNYVDRALCRPVRRRRDLSRHCRVDQQHACVFRRPELSHSGQNEGQSSGDSLSAQTFIGSILGIDIDEAAEGGFLQYWCWIGGSCNSDGWNDQSFCIIQMSANCSSLVVDIFPNE